MTLLQAMGNAGKNNLKVCHPLIGNGGYIPLSDLQMMHIPVGVAISNEWELEARICNVNEHAAKSVIGKVLRKYVPQSKIDEMSEAIVAEFFVEHV